MKVALVHDWLTGMRGGEKCLEVLCRRFPDARLFTLLHRRARPRRRSSGCGSRTSFLQRLPGVAAALPLAAAADAHGDPSGCAIPDDVDLVVSFSHAVAKSIVPPPGVPHVCYCFTPMRYAWHRRADYFRVSGPACPSPIAAARNLVLDRIREWDRATSDRVTHFVAISRTVARRIAECYGRRAG